MNFMNVMRKAAKIRFFLALLFVGIIMITVASIFISLTSNREMIPCEGTVVKIETYEEFGETHHRVFVDYTVEGKEYLEIDVGDNYHTGMKAGETIDLEYDPQNPEEVSVAGGELFFYIFLGIGIVAVLASLIVIIREIKKGKSDENEFDRVNLAEADEFTMEEIRNNEEPLRDYYFHFTGKLGQSFVLETTEREAVYRADCEKMTFFKPTHYTFLDCVTQRREEHMISHTITTSYGSSRGSVSYSIPTSSSFKIDGVNNWEYLGKKGYSIVPHIEGIKLNFDVLHYGIKVADLTSAGTNILKDGATNPLGKIPGNGLYCVSCKESDIPAVFLVCFIVSRVEFF